MICCCMPETNVCMITRDKTILHSSLFRPCARAYSYTKHEEKSSGVHRTFSIASASWLLPSARDHRRPPEAGANEMSPAHQKQTQNKLVERFRVSQAMIKLLQRCLAPRPMQDFLLGLHMVLQNVCMRVFLQM